MEDMLWKFPHIGEGIFKKLSNKNVVKCKKVARTWESFIVNDRFLKQRVKYETMQKEKDANTAATAAEQAASEWRTKEQQANKKEEKARDEVARIQGLVVAVPEHRGRGKRLRGEAELLLQLVIVHERCLKFCLAPLGLVVFELLLAPVPHLRSQPGAKRLKN